MPESRLTRILVVSRQFPLDFDRATHGIFQRLRNLLDAACSAARAVDALFFVPPEIIERIDVQQYDRMLRERWGVELNLRLSELSKTRKGWAHTYLQPIFDLRYHPDFAPTAGISLGQAVRKALRPDTQLILAHRLAGALPVVQAGRLQHLPPWVMDLDDVEHLKNLRELLRPPYWPGKLWHFLQVPAIALGERSSARRAASLYVCSERDRRYLRRVLMVNNAEVIPNAVEVSSLEEPTYRASVSRKILYVGTYTHRPNVEAAEFLVREVFPRVRQRLPDAELELVGNKVETLSTFAQAHPGVVHRGFVQSLDPVFKSAGVLCCPILAGSGTRIKIIEAAARGVPVVSTRIGAEGLDFENGREIRLHDDAEGLAQACVELLTSPVIATRQARAARVKALRYDRRQIISTLAASLLRASKGH